jgi:hypothetical protein
MGHGEDLGSVLRIDVELEGPGMTIGWSYLGGKLWSEVSRDERFFCQRAFTLADADPSRFVDLVERRCEIGLDKNARWEIGFEVCFFRDMRILLGKAWKPDFYYSPKRTFDLCLFSEHHVIIIEAKAQQGFESDQEQLSAFREDAERVRAIPGESAKVSVVALAASSYLTDSRKQKLRMQFGCASLTWLELAQEYGMDTVLLRADRAYEPRVVRANNERFLSGQELLALWKAGMKTMWVGRGGGADGDAFRKDVSSGVWRTRPYETNTGEPEAANPNWFSLDDFAERVGRSG